MSIDDMQFGFMPGKGSIFIMRQVQEKHQAKKNKLYYAFFVDLEKAFDRVVVVSHSQPSSSLFQVARV